MKPQDSVFLIVFLLVFLLALVKKNYRYPMYIGIFCVLIAIPLFAKYVFFTAEHLIWYTAAFFLLSIVLFIVKK